MRLSKIRLKNFKRFDDLTIELGNSPKKIVALVGPNGCGKSSVFDAFEEKLKDYKTASAQEAMSYFLKIFYTILPGKKSENYNKNESITLVKDDGTSQFDKKSFYIRSAYRFTPKLKVDSIKAQPDILEDKRRPFSSNAMDSRLQENYERMLGKLLYDFEQGDKTGKEFREELLTKINNILENVLEVKISSLGEVVNGRGQLYFEKETSKDFPYENLSSGEKEVVDIIIDLLLKTPSFDNTVYCIDEPELHLNTGIQRKLLIEIEKLIPEGCQLWVATHSIGFLRALQEELKDKCQILDFQEKDYFNGEQTIYPMKFTRKNWQRIFETALADLTGLMAPKRIIYCEGRPEPGLANEEQGFDAEVYNTVFEEEFNDILFVSGGGRDLAKNTALALKIISKAFNEVGLYLLKDMDSLVPEERQIFIDSSDINRMLLRREIENYLFDAEILKAYCQTKATPFNELRYKELVTDICLQDLKAIQQPIQHEVCGDRGSVCDFKLQLAKEIKPETAIYQELKGCIFIQKAGL